MAASSMDDSSIRELEKQCREANAEFHAQADSTIKHADALEKQVTSGKLDSAKFRSGAFRSPAMRRTSERPIPRPDTKL